MYTEAVDILFFWIKVVRIGYLEKLSRTSAGIKGSEECRVLKRMLKGRLCLRFEHNCMWVLM